MEIFVADFETNNSIDDCRVWAWGIESLEKDNFDFGINIEGFFKHIINNKIKQIYFHNLKFDGDFILHYLMRNGYKYSEKPTKNKTFSCLISGTGVFYSITINVGVIIKIYDSFKLMPTSIEKLGFMLGDKFHKGKIDYEIIHPLDQPLSYSEIKYLKQDVKILKKALVKFMALGGNKSTIGANSLHSYKQTQGKIFNKLFPQIDEGDIRLAYKGGYTYVNDKYANKILSNGRVYDVNSLYPYILYSKMLPWGDPVKYEGKYIFDSKMPLYIQVIEVNFDLKDNYVPTIQIKNSFRFMPNKYIKSTNGESVILCLTNIDLEILLKHYDVWEIHYLYGFKFRGKIGMFKEYIDKWSKIKIENNDNPVMRYIAKLYLNNLYGKFGTNPRSKTKIPVYLTNEGKIIYKQQESLKKGVYLPVAIFTTAYARQHIITAIENNIDNFIYCDTDSLHLLGDDVTGIEVDSVKLGAFKLESIFTTAKFLRAKTYVECIDDKLHICCCGMPKSCYKYVTLDNFKFGSIYNGKKATKKVRNGTIIYDTTFKII